MKFQIKKILILVTCQATGSWQIPLTSVAVHARRSCDRKVKKKCFVE